MTLRSVRKPPGTVPSCGVRGTKGDFLLLRRRFSATLLISCGLAIFLIGCGDSPPAPSAKPAADTAPQPKDGGDAENRRGLSPFAESAASSEAAQKGTVPLSAGGSPTGAESTASDESAPLLTDVTEQLGFKLPTTPWPDGTYATPEITPGGIALLDYDNDGRLDILQICHGPPGAFDQIVPNRLWHQEPDGTFREVPGAGGLKSGGYAHGVAVGDTDNKGYPDVFITSFGGDRFYHNNGDGTFTDRTAQAGYDPAAHHWSSSCCFFDYDRDGYLDLFVTRFAIFDSKKKCLASADANELDYCGPHTFVGVLSTLYHNNRDGTFTDVTAQAGIDAPSRGWGVVCADFTGDGWPDIFVANDEEPAQLWVNQHDGTFKEEAIERGFA